jgi:hypothetical protein
LLVLEMAKRLPDELEPELMALVLLVSLQLF